MTIQNTATIYNTSGVYNQGQGGGGGASDLPVNGTLAHEWNFKNSFVDSIGGVTARQENHGEYSELGYPRIDIDRGIFLDVEVKEKDYFEIIIERYVSQQGNGYLRLITKSASANISDQNAFLIGPHNTYLESYFSSWIPNIQGPFTLFSKVGIYLPDKTKMSVFYEDIPIKEDFVNNWGNINIEQNKYGVGSCYAAYADGIATYLVRARVYRHCTLK